MNPISMTSFYKAPAAVRFGNETKKTTFAPPDPDPNEDRGCLFAYAPTPNGEFIAAVDRNDIHKATELLESGQANANALDHWRDTALNILSKCRFTSDGVIQSFIQLLLDAGASLEIPNFAGNRPLHTAAMHGRLSEVIFFLKKGADSTATNKDGRTAIDFLKNWGLTAEELEELKTKYSAKG